MGPSPKFNQPIAAFLCFKIDDSNWFIWTQKMMGALHTIGMTGIVTGKIPALNLEEKKDWDRSDGMLSGCIYRRVSDEYQYLVQYYETGTTAWAALKACFKKSTIVNCMTACAAFYKVQYEPSCPIFVYIQALQSTKQKLTAFGVQIDNTNFKDVLLILPNPDLAKIKVMLASSAATDSVTIKVITGAISSLIVVIAVAGKVIMLMPNLHSGSSSPPPSHSPPHHAHIADANLDSVLVQAGSTYANLFGPDPNDFDLTFDDEWYAALSAQEQAPYVL
ncbi:hypothetical protein J132_10234 [Termitomyces sp. J132]|nr:hypothetical protein J132_10234 [Termitomyces sp. J132]